MSQREDLEIIKAHVEKAGQVTTSLSSIAEDIAEVVDIFYDSVNAGGRIYTCGNGGSACDAMHLAEELVARYYRERPGIRAQHLIDSGTMTCWANDYDFESVFERQVETLATEADVVVGFSTSGNSNNVLRAINAGKKIGAKTVAFTGRDGGEMAQIADKSLIVAADLTCHIQVAHVACVHIVCDRLELRLFPDSVCEDKP